MLHEFAGLLVDLQAWSVRGHIGPSPILTEDAAATYRQAPMK